MDTGEGWLEPIQDLRPETVEEFRKKHPKAKGGFTVGEGIEIRGSRFRVKDISPWGIKLKLLPALEEGKEE